MKALPNRIAGRWGMVWRKQFLPGAILEGLNYWDRLEFVDRWHCAMWLRGVRRNIRAGKLEWRFTDRPTTARVLDQALQAIEVINSLLQREPYGLGAQLLVQPLAVLEVIEGSEP